MTQTPVAPGNLFAQVLDPASRANPYPLYARLRETPVSLQADGTYVVSVYQEINALLHDPRISSDERKGTHGGALVASGRLSSEPSFIFTDPPEHTRLRRLIMHQFTPQRIAGMREHIERTINALLDAKKHERQLDLVQDFAYPLPVTVICRLLGVPPEDEPRFRVWSSALVRTLDPKESLSEAEVQQAVQFRTRTTLAEVPIAGVAIPQGASVVLVLAAGSRDPARFVDPDRFWPERADSEHLGFGGGDHYCVGAPLARLEAVTALKALARRLEAPRLVTDPPPYRKNAALRGPEHLQIAFDHLSD